MYSKSDILTINTTDMSGQRQATVDIARDATIDDLIRGSAERMGLFEEDARQRRVSWHARDEKRGVALHRSQIVGEALEDKDTVRIQPEVIAGTCV